MQTGNIATWVGIVITLLISLATRRDANRQAQIAEEANIASQAQVEAAERRAIAVEDNLAQALKLLAQSQTATTPLQSLATPDPSGRPAVGWTCSAAEHTPTCCETGARRPLQGYILSANERQPSCATCPRMRPCGPASHCSS